MTWVMGKREKEGSNSSSDSSSTDEDGQYKRERRRHKKMHSNRRKHEEEEDESDSTESSSEEKEEKQKRRKKRKHSSSNERSSKKSKELRMKKKKKKKKKEKRKREKHGGNSGKREREGRKRRDDSLDSASSSSEASLPDNLLNPTAIALHILESFPEVAPDLYQLLQLIDNGQAVDISGLPNRALATSLKDLFYSLQLQQAKNGMFFLSEEVHKKTLGIVGPIFSSLPRKVHEGSEQLEEDGKLESCVEPERKIEMEAKPSQAPISCDNSEPKRRFVGPAMPSAEMLAAAARLTEAGSALREAEEELLLDPMIGPPPPVAVAEAASTNEAERFEEISRILAPDIGNAYEVLALKLDASLDVIKKRYWKLSLMVHPDKCNHPQAHQAFTALNQAFKDLCDPTKRSAIDSKVKEKEAREEYQAELKAQRDAAHWRRIRGEPLPGDEMLLGEGPKPRLRDEWMTVLPPERQAGAPSMHSTYFSKYEKSGRGDTSVWTDSPLEKAQKAKTQYIEAFEQARLAAAKDDKPSNERECKSQVGQMMDNFNESKRKKSLFEKHQEVLRSEVKQEKQKKKQKDSWDDKHPWRPWDREKDLSAGRQNLKLDAESVSHGLSSRFSTSAQERSFL